MDSQQANEWKDAEPGGRRRPPDCPSPCGLGQSAPRWSFELENESVRRVRALYLDLPETERGGYLALTAAVPPPILGSASSSRLAFMRFEDLVMQRGTVSVQAMARAAEQAAAGGGPQSEGPGCPLSARLGKTWTDAELKAWCDRFEAGCRALGVTPRLRMYE